MDILSCQSKDGDITIQSRPPCKDDWVREGEWIRIFDLLRAKQYNGKIGVIISLFEKHVEIKLLGSNKKQKNLKVPLHKVSRLDQKHAYINDAKCMKSSSSLSSKASKGSKYTRLVNFIYTLLKQQNTSPVLITDNPPPISADSVKFWKIPCVGTGSSLSSTDILYMRLPEPCLIEALLMRDIGSLVEVVSFQNHYMNSMAKKFRGQITELTGYSDWPPSGDLKSLKTAQSLFN